MLNPLIVNSKHIRVENTSVHEKVRKGKYKCFKLENDKGKQSREARRTLGIEFSTNLWWAKRVEIKRLKLIIVFRKEESLDLSVGISPTNSISLI